VKIELVDLERARELHALAFQWDDWPGDSHHFWWIRDGIETPAAFGAARIDSQGRCVIERVAVGLNHGGRGLGKRLVRHMLRWGLKEGARIATSYCAIDNHRSIVMLLGAGFKFAKTTGRRWHNFEMTLG
jgi:RimJ/RimL family protein N-acetyltransferase